MGPSRNDESQKKKTYYCGEHLVARLFPRQLLSAVTHGEQFLPVGEKTSTRDREREQTQEKEPRKQRLLRM